jgi:hypothetical protein
VGTTPDPILFDRREPTHCFERPPSFWLFLLESLGLISQFRFSVDSFNFQFVAAKAPTSTAQRLELMQHDYFSKEPDFVTVRQSDQMRPFFAVPRMGWGALTKGTRSLKQSPASIYLLNSAAAPVRAVVQLRTTHSPDFSTFRVRLDSHVLDELNLTSEKTDHSLSFEMLIPAGGHHLYFDLFPGGPEVLVSEIEFEIAEASPAELVGELPFDLQQRYRLAASIAQIVTPGRILDVGGFLGDQDGHLATSADFLCPNSETVEVVTTDLRHCDHPSHHPCEATRQPFPSGSFDLVVSLDVLEHIPEEQRNDYLAELDRVSSRWILLGAPFYSKSVEDLETSLADQLNLEFLNEHRQQGLPAHSLIEDFFITARGYSLKAFPNGYLPVWGTLQLLTHHLFSVKDHRAIKAFNRVYSRHIYPTDQRPPSYRTLYLIGKSSFSHSQLPALDALISQVPSPGSVAEGISFDPELASILRVTSRVQEAHITALGDLQFLINERQKGIAALKSLNEELQTMPVWKLVLKRIRRRISGRPSQ